MLSFKGELSAELVTALLGVVEHKMELIEPDPRVRKRVFNVAMECLQNLFHHNARVEDPQAGAMRSMEPQGVVMIVRNDKGYSVLTGNFMAGNDVNELKERLERINTMLPEELRDLYKTTLADGKYGAHGGGGLGIIDIARRSGRKLEYGFVPYDKDNSFFSLNVDVSH